MSQPGYRLLPHTADVAIAAWGPSVADAFAEAVRGVLAVTFDPRRVRCLEERPVEIHGDDLTQLLVALLQEVVYLIDAEGFLPACASVQISERGLQAHLQGERYDPERHRRVGPMVKAITYHQASVDPGPPARLRVILDI